MKTNPSPLLIAILACLVPLASVGRPPDTTAKSQAAALAQFPELAREGSPLHAKFLALIAEKKAAAPSFFKRRDWPEILAKEAADALAPKTARLAVESVNVKKLEVPGVLWGTNTIYRYFFRLRNTGNARFVGKVTIWLISANGQAGGSESFNGRVAEDGGGSVVYLDMSTAPSTAIHGTWAYRRFRFIAEGTGTFSGDGAIVVTNNMER